MDVDVGADEIGVDELFGDPQLFLRRLDPGRREVELWSANRETYRRSAFLDERMSTHSTTAYTLPLAALLALEDALPEASGVHYLFHSAFCCSTLVARALELPGVSFALKEPSVYLTLADLRRHHLDGGDPPWPRLLALVQAFIGRTWEPQEHVVVKPSDACNNLILPLLQHDPSSRALLLSSSLPEFLLSVLKSSGRREWTRERMAAAQHDAAGLGVLAHVDSTALDDAQRAAYLWLVQQHVFLQAVDVLDSTQVRTLDCSDLLASPVETMTRLVGFLGLDLPSERLASAVVDCFGAHAKAPELPYDAQARADAQATARSEHADELRHGLEWALEVGDGTLPWSANAAPL